MGKVVGIVLMIMVLGSLTGCSKKVWMIPDGQTQMDFERDKAQCRYEARIYTPPSRAFVPPPPASNLNQAGAAVGLSILATGIARGLEEGTHMALLFNQCMNARGYYLVDKPQPQQPVADIKPIPKTPILTPTNICYYKGVQYGLNGSVCMDGNGNPPFQGFYMCDYVGNGVVGWKFVGKSCNTNSPEISRIPPTNENPNPESIAGRDEAWRQRLRERGLLSQ